MTHDHLFNRIVEEMEVGEITGWCETQKALELAMAVVTLHPKVIVELGVWGGRSFLPMAMACESLGNGIAIAIDPWSHVASVEGYDKLNADWWGKQDHEAVYQGFMGHVRRLNLAAYVRVIRAKSDDTAPPPVIDLLHIDGQHSEQAVRDVRRFGAKVRVGGIVCMDDLNWTVDGVPHVAKAVTALLKLGFVELYRTKTEQSCWGFFQRVSAPCTGACGKLKGKK